jgi:Leucine-rich repeat (LRR) protein
MTITIKFNNNTVHNYNSIEEILKIDNYDDIIYIYCAYENLSSLPKLPNSIHELWCSNNNLSRLPELPNSLTKLCCSNNCLAILPELPNSIIYLNCSYNLLSSLPELPNSLIEFVCSCNNLSSLPKIPKLLKTMWCSNNNLSSLPELPNSSIFIYYHDNPIYIHIENYFNSDRNKYFKYYEHMKRIFSNKIGNWFLECKYNPKYLYCRKRLMKEYDEFYN